MESWSYHPSKLESEHGPSHDFSMHGPMVSLKYKEAAIAGRLARLVQQAADQEEEPRSEEGRAMHSWSLALPQLVRRV